MGLLSGKCCLITGAGQGIGRGIAMRFGREGAAVGVLDVVAAASQSVAAEIVAGGGRAIALPADVARAEHVALAVDRLAASFGPPNVLVHNAAIMPEGTIVETSEPDWDRVFAVNVKGAYLASRAVIPHMRQAGGGAIILMASITGVNGLPGLAAYSATKGALISMARAMAVDHAREGIRVNSVAPGTIDSPMLHEAVAATRNPEVSRRAFDEIQPRGRVGSIEEVVNVFVFLAFDQASFVSGANLRVDGGMSIKTDQPRL
jgi:NAD(P)-dependent dehydrogenase (short-subunit alcohol dehydrogenase family)